MTADVIHDPAIDLHRNEASESGEHKQCPEDRIANANRLLNKGNVYCPEGKRGASRKEEEADRNFGL